MGSSVVIVSFPDPTLCEGKGLGTLESFLGLAHHHVIACDNRYDYIVNSTYKSMQIIT